ncbi:MAG: glycosyltransferase family 2 protein [Vicinamibacterales bacterium]|nr:glycosyltransferase family 2 protein [Vicinamibacterales bacterium]
MSMASGRESGPAPALTVVIPAFNEAANVEPVVAETLEVLRGTPWLAGFELVLVDDGSRDGTGEVMDRLAAAHSEVVVAHHQANRGFGAALTTGYRRSRGDAVTFITADGEIGVDQPLRLVREMGDRDLMLSGRVRSVGAGRGFLTWGVNWTSRIILGFWPDDSVGIYVVRGDVLRRIPLHSTTGLANLEILLYCRAHRLNIAMSGVTEAKPRLSGESKVTNLRTIVKTLWEMLKLRVRTRGEQEEGGR